LANLHGQIEQCRKYAEGQGWSVVGELIENAQSGNVLVTPKQQLALDMADRQEFDILVARAVDRLKGRAGGKYASWYSVELERRGVQVRYADPSQQFQDMPNYAALIETAHAEGAAEERKRVVENMRRGRMRILNKGSIIVGKYAPFGYRLKETGDPERRYELVIDPTEAAIVRDIYKWYTVGDGTEGPLSLRAIGKRLQTMGITTVTGGTQWWQNTVAKMVKSETYAGVWTYGKHSGDPEQLISIEVPAIVDRSTWEAAQKRLRVNQAESKRKTSHNYLLQHRLSCGVCGEPMGGFDSGRYYRCRTQTRRKQDNVPCENRSAYRVATIDQMAWRWLLQLLLQPDAIIETYELQAAERQAMLQPAEADLATVERALAKERAKLDRLLTLYLEGTWDQEQLDRQRSGIEAAMASLRNRQERLRVMLNAETMTKSEAEELQQYVDQWRDQVLEIDQGDPSDPEIFRDRRRLVEILDMRGIVWADGKQRKLQLSSRVSGATVFELPTHWH
jgi:site-specific DNA recombinase